MRRTRTATRAVIVAFLAIGLMATTAVAGQRSQSQVKKHQPAKVTLVHGIDGKHDFPVDISLWRLGGKITRFEDVTYGTVAGPIDVKPGIYRVSVRAAGSPIYSKPLLKRWVWLWSGTNKSVVAHLRSNGSPTLSAYRNDVSNSHPGARVTVRHNAAVGPVNVYADGTKVISRLKNPHEAVLDIPDTTLNIEVQVAGGPTVFDADVSFAEDTNTIIYATLDAQGNFNPLLQVLPTA